MRQIIKVIATNLSKQYRTNDPFELADYLNIFVHEWDLPEVNGIYHNCQNEKHIFINSSLDNYMKKIACAHEIGHALLHENLNNTFLKTKTLFDINRLEKEADLFCAELLVPDSELEEYPYYSLQQLAAVENVPVKLMKLKFGLC